MSLLAILMGCIFSGSTIVGCTELPIDHGIVHENVIVNSPQTPLFEGFASWYDYKLSGKQRSKSHSTCALRIKERYGRYKVCSDRTGKCIECYHNDYGPARLDRVIDLSSYAFKQLGEPLSRGLTYVKVYKVE